MLLSLALGIAAAAGEAGKRPIDGSECRAALEVDASPQRPRPINDRDLIETLDIGSISDIEPDPMFAVSPDGVRIAAGVRRADVASNSYCTGLYLIDRGRARLIDFGPGAAFWRFENFYGTNGFPSGIPKLMTMRWSPDGKTLAYLKFAEGKLQVWVMDETSRVRAVGKSDQDIIDFRFTPDGRGIVYKVRDETNQSAAMQSEGRRGFRFDGRYFPFESSRPFPTGRPAYLYRTGRLEDESTRPATALETRLFSATNAPQADAANMHVTTAPDTNGVARITATQHGDQIACPSVACTDIDGVPWIETAGIVRYIRREGWARSETAIYEWRIGSAEPRRLFTTSDLLMNCTPNDGDILCARERSKRPRYLDRIDLRTGRSTVIFDPNPAFQKLTLGRVERLNWKNDRGIDCFGDLTYPPDYKPGRRYPLIVVQYESRGFLRGGTGDEYPVQLFARAGYLVLTVQRPRSPLLGQNLPSIERQRRQNEGFMERQSIVSAIETKVKDLITSGLADPDRIGITGLSDGSTTVQYAALHSQLFKAAAVSGCCWEPSQTWVLGPSLQSHYASLGWPESPEDKPSMWADISLTRNASRVAFPLLIQAAAGEYLVSLEAVRALRSANSPIDLYVFPDEVHIKRQPAHRASIYARNLRWFDFWLLGKRLPEGDDGAEEVENWAKMQRTWHPAPPPGQASLSAQ